MERWVADTLRGLGIAVIVIIALPANLLLLLLSFCSYTGGFENHRDPGAGIAYLIGAILLNVIAFFIISRLGRGILRPSSTHGPSSTTISETSPESETTALPIRFSPASQQALQHLIYAFGAGILLDAIFWATSLFHVARQYPLMQNRSSWIVAGILSAALNYLPDILLFFRLRVKPDRPALAFAMAVPAASLLRSITGLPLIWSYILRSGDIRYSLLPTIVGLGIQAGILALAIRANQRLGYRQEAVGIVVAVIVSYGYFMIFGSASTWFRQLVR